MLLIITENSSINRGILNWEIKKAIYSYGLPIIAAYTGFEKILNPNLFRERWPEEFKNAVDLKEVKAIHIPFKKYIIGDAISQFTVHENNLTDSLSIYSPKAYNYFESLER